MVDKWSTNDDTQNYPFIDNNQGMQRMDAQLNEPTYLNSIKVPKVVRPKNETLLQNFGDKCK